VAVGHWQPASSAVEVEEVVAVAVVGVPILVPVPVAAHSHTTVAESRVGNKVVAVAAAVGSSADDKVVVENFAAGTADTVVVESSAVGKTVVGSFAAGRVVAVVVVVVVQQVSTWKVKEQDVVQLRQVDMNSRL
jgi:hypothetical protein